VLNKRKQRERISSTTEKKFREKKITVDRSQFNILLTKDEAEMLERVRMDIAANRYMFGTDGKKLAFGLLVIFTVICDIFVIYYCTQFDIFDELRLWEDVETNYVSAKQACTADPFITLDYVWKVQYDAQMMEINENDGDYIEESDLFGDRDDGKKWFLSVLLSLTIGWFAIKPALLLLTVIVKDYLFPPAEYKSPKESPSDYVHKIEETDEELTWDQMELFDRPQFILECEKLWDIVLEKRKGDKLNKSRAKNIYNSYPPDVGGAELSLMTNGQKNDRGRFSFETLKE